MDDVVLLSRIQFAFTVMFHYLFPPLSIGLGLILVIFEACYLKTKDRFWLNLTKFWVLLFAATFAMGVASGIVLEFEFGTNWAVYSRFVGDVFGSALAAEGIFAFFLESGFLAVLLFGWNRVGPKMHFFSTLMVFLGSVFSSVWIVIANCYMQTPAGDKIVPILIDGKTWIVEGEIMRRAEIHDFWALVFNPSTIERLTHVWAGALILGGCFVLSVSAFYLIKGRHERFAKCSFKIALVVALAGTLLAGFTGDMSARGVAKNQPQKLAAMEGHYKTNLDEPTGLALFGIPNDKEEKLDLAVEVPGLLSMMVHHDLETPIVGQDAFPKNDRPNTFLTFWSFRVMVGIGMTLMALTGLGLLLLYKGLIFKSKLLLWVFVVAVIPAFAGNQFGWLTAEFGRQPFMVYPKYDIVLDGRKNTATFKDYARAGIEDGAFTRYYINPENQVENGLRVSDGVSRAIKSEMVLGSIIMFIIIYGLLFFVWVYVLHMKITKGPQYVDGDEPYEDIEAQKAQGFFASTEGWTEGSMTAAQSENMDEESK